MVNQVENWYTNIPIITRCILTLSCVLSVLVTLDVISPLHLYLNYRQVWYPKYQVWRLFTHFFFFDRLSINFVLHMYFVYFYCTRLESHTFHRRSADFLWMILFGMLGMTLLSPILSSLFSLVHHTLYHIIYPTLHSLYTHLTVLAMSSLSSSSSGSNHGNYGNGGSSESMGGGHHNGDGNITKTNNVVVISLPFMSHSLVIMMLYVWSRFNPHERLRLYGLFTISASYLSYVMLVLGMVMGMSPLNDMNGILIGHLYYFLNHVLPMEYPHVTTMVNNNGGNGSASGAGIGSGGVIRAPQFLCKLLNPPTASSTAVADDVIVINDDDGDEQQQEQEQPVVQDEREDGEARNNNHHGEPPRLFMDNGDDDDGDNGEDENNNDGNPLLTTRQRNVQQQQEHRANGE